MEESQRGKGFGKILIKEVYEYAKKAECMEVELFVMENNEEAIKFYEKQGFKTERKWMVKTLEG